MVFRNLLGQLSLAVLVGAVWLFPQFGLLAVFPFFVWFLAPRSRPNTYLGWFFCFVISMSVAFHWTPASLAFNMGTSALVGFLVAFPILLWEASKYAICFWLPHRMGISNGWYWIAVTLGLVCIEQFLPSIFPYRFGYLLLETPILVQAVDLLGNSFSTVVFTSLAALAAWLIRILFVKEVDVESPQVSRFNTKMKPIGNWFAAIVVTFSLTYGWFAMQRFENMEADATRIRIGMVQVEPGYVESLDNARTLTSQLGSVDLICWPESIGGVYDLSLDSFQDPNNVFALSAAPSRGLRPLESTNTPLVFGGKCYQGDRDEPDLLYTSAFLMASDLDIADRYHKRFRMPFGEYVPGESVWPGVIDYFNIDHIDASPDGAHPLRIKTDLLQADLSIGVMLCFEDMSVEAARSQVAAGADFLLTLADGSAFESPFTLRQHLLLARMRSIENRRAFARCASTGETCFISSTGKMRSRIPLQTNGILEGEIPILHHRTVSCIAGDLTKWCSLILTIIWLGGSVLIGLVSKPINQSKTETVA